MITDPVRGGMGNPLVNMTDRLSFYKIIGIYEKINTNRLESKIAQPNWIELVEGKSKRINWKPLKRNRFFNRSWVIPSTNPDGPGFLPHPPWSLTETNNGRWIWWTCKNSVDGTKGTNICWRWLTSCPSMPGPFPSNPKARKKWSEGWPASTSKPRRGDRSACRRIKAKNSTIEGCKLGSRNRGRIIFPRLGIARPRWWNDGIARWNSACTVISRRTIRYGTWTSYNRWFIRTITPIIGALVWPRIKSPPKQCLTYGIDSMGHGCTKRPHLPNVEWGIVYVSTRNTAPSKKGICPAGRKKYSWSRTSVVILSSPINSVNGTARL